ncbi:hypothetical protein ID866_12822, partial [Astraeus odoratus]
MSFPHCTSSPHKCCLAKTKAPGECMEEEWQLVSEGKLDPVLSNDKNMRWEEVEKRTWEEAKHLAHEEAAKKALEEAERQAEEVCKVQEEARAKEEAERIAREAAEREEAVKRVVEAAEERADTERRALKEHLWEAAGQWSEAAVTLPWVAKPSGQMTVAGPSAPGCSWSKKMVREMHKQKQVQRSEEVEEVIKVDEDEDKEWSHFVVPTHLTEEHWDALRALTMTLDMLSMDFHTFWHDSWNLSISILRAMEAIADELQQLDSLKEEEMGKGKGEEKAKEEDGGVTLHFFPCI